MSSYDQHQRQANPIACRCAIITLSDTRTPQTDTSGQTISRLLEEAGHSVAEYRLLRDDKPLLQQSLDQLLADLTLDVILTTGGTGISRRDTAIDVIEARLDLRLPGFGELFRLLSWEQIGSGAMLSRAAAGAIGDKLIVAMPGSTAAVELAMTRLVIPELRHLLHQLRK